MKYGWLRYSFFVWLILATTPVLFAQTYRCQVKVNGLWGFIDETGTIVIEPEFGTTEPFSSDGVALVKPNQATYWIMIDKNGNRIPTEFRVLDPNDSKFNEGMLPVKLLGKYGYINTQGKVVIPAIYNDATPWSNGLGIVKKNKNFFIIDGTGKTTLIESVGIKKFNPFAEGMASFKTSLGTMGFIDTDGKVVIPPRYASVGQFFGGLAWVKGQTGLVSYIKKDGKQAFNIFFDVAKDFDVESQAALVKEGGQWKYFTMKGNRIHVTADYFGNFSNGLAYCRTSNGVGFIDSMGLWVIHPQFRSVRDFKNGFAAASNLDTWGIIDGTGNWVVSPKFQAIKDMEKID